MVGCYTRPFAGTKAKANLLTATCTFETERGIRFNLDKVIVHGMHSGHVFCRDIHALPLSVFGSGKVLS